LMSADGDWDLDLYWDITHGGHTQAEMLAEDPATYPVGSALPFVSAPSIPTPNYPPTAAGSPPKPSRYDVYLYENANGYINVTAPNGETGAPSCYTGPPIDDSERRVIFTAIINCIDQADELYGASGDPVAIAFARSFMTKPALHDGSDKEMYIEIIDITGNGGLGTVEDLLREEAELVR